MHHFYVSFNDQHRLHIAQQAMDYGQQKNVTNNRLNLKVSKLGRHAMRLKFYKIKNQQEKILHELKKIFNVKDSNDQDRIRYFSDSSPLF